MLTHLLLALYILLEGSAVAIVVGLDVAQVGLFDPRRKRWAIRAVVLMLAGFALIPFMAKSSMSDVSAEQRHR